MRMATRVRLDSIPSMEEALCDLGIFAFVALHLYSIVGWHLSAVVDLFLIIERL